VPEPGPALLLALAPRMSGAWQCADGDEERPRKIEPRTGLVRSGLDANPPRPYHLYEEIVAPHRRPGDPRLPAGPVVRRPGR